MLLLKIVGGWIVLLVVLLPFLCRFLSYSKLPPTREVDVAELSDVAMQPSTADTSAFSQRTMASH